MKTISRILRIIYYTLFLGGAFFAYGTVGNLETDQITIPQFWCHELIAFGVIFFAFIVPFFIASSFLYLILPHYF